MDVVDDVRLVALAQEPVRELLPISRPVTAVGPLVILLAFVPGLFFFPEPVLDTDSARVALQSLDSMASEKSSQSLLGAIQTVLPHGNGPLASWLTAVSLRLEFLSPTHRLLVVSYGGSVLLALGLFAACRRWGSLRFALVAIVIASCHPLFLSLGGRLPAHSLSLAMAVWTFSELSSHNADDDNWLSWPLLRAGLWLGACVLVNPLVGSAAAGVFLLQCVLACGSQRLKSVVLSRRWLSAALVNLLRGLFTIVAVVLVASLFILALAMIQKGWTFSGAWLAIEQWQLSGLPKIPRVGATAFGKVSFGAASRAVLGIAGLLSGLVMLGVVSAFGSQPQKAKSEWERCGRSWLLAWSIVAMGLWWTQWPLHGGEFVSTSPWPAFMLIPLSIWGARGAEALLTRQWGLEAAVAAVLVTVMTNVAPSIAWNVSAADFGRMSWTKLALATGTILSLLFLAVRRLKTQEVLIRRSLLMGIAGLLLANAASGIASLPNRLDDDRELFALRKTLSAESIPEECWLIVEDDELAISPRLQFFARTLWQGVSVRTAKNWEAILTDRAATASRIVIVWGSVKWTTADGRRIGQAVTPITSSHYFERRPLKAYRWSRRS